MQISHNMHQPYIHTCFLFTELFPQILRSKGYLRRFWCIEGTQLAWCSIDVEPTHPVSTLTYKENGQCANVSMKCKVKQSKSKRPLLY